MVSLKEEEKFGGTGKQNVFKSAIINKEVMFVLRWQGEKQKKPEEHELLLVQPAHKRILIFRCT